MCSEAERFLFLFYCNVQKTFVTRARVRSSLCIVRVLQSIFEPIHFGILPRPHERLGFHEVHRFVNDATGRAGRHASRFDWLRCGADNRGRRSEAAQSIVVQLLHRLRWPGNAQMRRQIRGAGRCVEILAYRRSIRMVQVKVLQFADLPAVGLSAHRQWCQRNAAHRCGIIVVSR